MEPTDVGLQIDGWAPVVYAKDQPEYLPLPSLRAPDGRIVTRWKLTDEERARLVSGEDLFLTVHTFGGPLQPLLPTVGEPGI